MVHQSYLDLHTSLAISNIDVIDTHDKKGLPEYQDLMLIPVATIASSGFLHVKVFNLVDLSKYLDY